MRESEPMPRRWRYAAETHIGARRTINEDAVLARPELGLWAVADGMGGHAAGDVASRAIADALARTEARESLAEMVDQVDDVLCNVNRQLHEHAMAHCSGRTVGSTVVTLVAAGEVGVVLWAGDSRLYRRRHGMLTQVTRDHSPVGDLLDDGLITERTAHARDSNVVTRAVGGHGPLFLDVAVFDVCLGDTFLLCSDGLHRELAHDRIGEVLGLDDVGECASLLVAECLERGARDNVSVVVSRCEG